MMREEEPIAHCYDCPQAKTGNCGEFKSLNPHYGEGYDRQRCHWGASSIKQLHIDLYPMIQQVEALRAHLLKTSVTYEELLLVEQLAGELKKATRERLERMKKA